MSKLETLKDALLEELKDLYSAETQLVKALPKMAKRAANGSLKAVFEGHLKETKKQVERLEKIGEIMNESLSGKTCKAMKGLIAEGKEVLDEESENCALIDALLIGAAQRVEHYEIAAYGTARAMADALQHEEIVALLQETLDEESAADEKLTGISEEEVLKKALTESEDDSDEDEDAKTGSPSFILTGLLALGVGISVLQPPTAFAETKQEIQKNEREAARYNPDNTGKNARDANDYRKTADDQDLQGGSDLEVLAQIRKDVVANDNLSTYGKNVKILVEGSTVTLRGPVATAEEKKWIADTAARVAPKRSIVNELEIAVK